jgi:hypothetical protein
MSKDVFSRNAKTLGSSFSQEMRVNVICILVRQVLTREPAGAGQGMSSCNRYEQPTDLHLTTELPSGANTSSSSNFPRKYSLEERDWLTFEDGTDMLSRNVGKQLPIYTVQDPRTAKPRERHRMLRYRTCVKRRSVDCSPAGHRYGKGGMVQVGE